MGERSNPAVLEKRLAGYGDFRAPPHRDEPKRIEAVRHLSMRLFATFICITTPSCRRCPGPMRSICRFCSGRSPKLEECISAKCGRRLQGLAEAGRLEVDVADEVDDHDVSHTDLKRRTAEKAEEEQADQAAKNHPKRHARGPRRLGPCDQTPGDARCRRGWRQATSPSALQPPLCITSVMSK